MSLLFLFVFFLIFFDIKNPLTPIIHHSSSLSSPKQQNHDFPAAQFPRSPALLAPCCSSLIHTPTYPSHPLTHHRPPSSQSSTPSPATPLPPSSSAITQTHIPTFL